MFVSSGLMAQVVSLQRQIDAQLAGLHFLLAALRQRVQGEMLISQEVTRFLQILGFVLVAGWVPSLGLSA